MQSEKTLNTQIYFFITKSQWDIILKRLDNKKNNNEAKSKNQQFFFKPNIYKRFKNHLL